MSAQAIARLEKLLTRVQTRRAEPRAVAAAAAPAPVDAAEESADVDEVSDELAASEPPLALVSRASDATLADDDLEVTTLPPSALESEPPDSLELDLEAEAARMDSEMPIPTGVIQAPPGLMDPEPEEATAQEPSEAPPAARSDEASFAGLASEPPTDPPAAPESAAEVRPLTLAPEPEPESEPETEQAPEAAAASAEPASEPDAPAEAALTEPSARIDHVVPQASGPVAFEEGELPSPDVLTFEDLIARSLSLRARG